MSTMMVGLELAGITVSYADRVAVRDVSISAGAGEWLGVIGPNGAGKSTVLKVLAGLELADGHITVGGRPLEQMDRRERARAFAYVPQEPVLPDDMPALDYVLLGRTAHLGYFASPSSSDVAVAGRALERLDLASFADRLLGHMSGGERQRVVLARALATEASVLLLDEPTTALDIGHQQQALDLVDDLRRTDGLTVISALHDLTLAGSYCDRLVLLQDGRVAAVGAPTEVLTAALIAEIYGAQVEVTLDDHGVVVTPRRRSSTAPPGTIRH